MQQNRGFIEQNTVGTVVKSYEQIFFRENERDFFFLSCMGRGRGCNTRKSSIPKNMNWLIFLSEKYQSLVFCVLLCGSLLFLLSLYFLPLHCQSFFDLWLLATTLVHQTFLTVAPKQPSFIPPGNLYYELKKKHMM